MATNFHCIDNFNSSPSPHCYFSFSEDLDSFNRWSSYLLAAVQMAQKLEISEDAYDTRFLWKKSSMDILSQLGRDWRFTDVPSVPSHLVSFIEERWGKAIIPKVPECVKKESGVTFVAKIPIFAPRLMRKSLQENEEYEVPIDRTDLEFYFDKDSANNHYLMNFVFMSSAGDRNQYKALLNRFNQAVDSCTAKEIPPDCPSAEQVLNEIDQFKDQLPYTKATIENELRNLTHSFHDFPSGGIKIPICP